ncbi:MAG: hypothetical protein K6G60_09335 [Lachnospiraceae bacterium]|nr:hypothetical protein [Lachnospiraceae bacterium]
MNRGKMPESALKRSVLKRIKGNVGNAPAGIGFDAGLFELGGKPMLMSTAAVFGNDEGMGELCVTRAVNSMAAAGGKASWISVSLCCPEEAAEDFAKRVMDEAVRGAEKCNVRIVSGNTLVAEQPMITVTATGEKVHDLKSPSKETQRILIMAGYAGNAGAAMLAKKKYELFAERLTGEFIEKALWGSEETGIGAAAEMLAERCGNAVSMHDISEGGVFGALWELLEREKAGCTVDLKEIPIKQAAIEVCEILDVSPYQIRGDGGLLAIVEDTPENRELGKVIGTVDNKADRVIVNGEERRFLEPNRYDGYYEF